MSYNKEWWQVDRNERSAYDRKVSELRSEGYDVDEFGHFYPDNDHTRVCGYFVDGDGNVHADM